ncbi:MAG: D-2-hydroxyacid dehydrogenase [Oscillospiraceae bacterium]|jgi:glycerate dehydrogenase|nr:D-2-hydroxyacid dehydrogenase [Oscillospiraceae bacterium]
MKIVILDGYAENPGDLSWAGLEAMGELTVYDRTSLTDEAEIISRMAGAQAVFTNKTPISAAAIAASPRLEFISMLATGYNVVDVTAAAKRGVLVSNIPTYGTMAVGQFAIALLLEICHHAGHHAQAVREGRWQNNPDWCFWDYPLIELAGKTMGIIGFGRIGQTTGAIAKAMGMRVIACDETVTDTGRAIAEYVSLDSLFSQSDVISLHCPLFESTREIVNRESIARMKDGVILINNSRGGLIVEQDLADALNSGKVYAAGLDVVSSEPVRGDNPLLTAKNCLITPHISWAPKESRLRLMEVAVANLRAFIEGKPINVVN